MNPEAQAYLEKAFEFASKNSFNEALVCCEEALKIEPGSALALFDKAFVLQNLGQAEEAIVGLEKSLQIDPTMYKSYRGLAVSLMSLGKHDEAFEILKKWISLDPEDLTPYQHLAAVKKFSQEDKELVKQMADKLAELDKDSQNEIAAELYFALGKIYDDMAEYDKAFTHFEKGNEIMRSLYPFDGPYKELVKYSDANISTYSKDFFYKRKKYGSNSQTPIFIVGVGRSGTTLVEQILASHSKIFGAGELTIAQQVANSVQQLQNSLILYPGCMEATSADLIKQLGGEYLSHLKTLSEDSPYVVDKMPHNFWLIGFLYLLFPKARFINCTRNRLDTFLSLYFAKFAFGNEYSYSFDGIVKYYKLYEKLMQHWRKTLPIEIFEIDYTNLVENSEKTAKDLIKFCGLDWEDSCFEPHKADTIITSGSGWQARQPIYKSSVGRWKNYEKHLTPLKKALEDIS